MNKKQLVIVFLGACIFLTGCETSKSDKANKYINQNNYEKALTYYEKLKDEEQTQVDKSLKSKIDEEYNLFINKQVEKQDALNFMCQIENFNGVSSYVKEYSNKIEDINNSRMYYNVGKEMEEYGKIKEALANYETVNILDEDNYNDAQNRIKELTIKLEEKEKIDKEKQEKELEERIAEENKYVISSTNIVPSEFNLYDGIQVLIKNNSDTPVKEFKLSFFTYDRNGLPIKVTALAGGDIYMSVSETNANIMPGETFGSDKVVNTYLDYGTVGNVKACLKEVIDYDGKKWTNPSYSQWYTDNYDKKYEE